MSAWPGWTPVKQLTEHLEALQGIHTGHEVALGLIERLDVPRYLADDDLALRGGVSDGRHLHQQVLRPSTPLT